MFILGGANFIMTNEPYDLMPKAVINVYNDLSDFAD